MKTWIIEAIGQVINEYEIEAETYEQAIKQFRSGEGVLHLETLEVCNEKITDCQEVDTK